MYRERITKSALFIAVFYTVVTASACKEEPLVLVEPTSTANTLLLEQDPTTVQVVVTYSGSGNVFFDWSCPTGCADQVTITQEGSSWVSQIEVRPDPQLDGDVLSCAISTGDSDMIEVTWTLQIP